MITVGVDLAAEPKTTAVARIDWSDAGASVQHVVGPADDAAIIELCTGAERVGIDTPLGWPEAFLDFVGRHHWDGGVHPEDGDAARWREPLTMRPTDLACAAFTRAQQGVAVRPLSVSADLLGHTAMRGAVLLARLAERGFVIDRTGVTGDVAEVYPAASLALWGLTDRGYKGAKAHRLGEVVDWFVEHSNVDLGGWGEQVRSSDHCFDAVIAACAARAVALGHATSPTPSQHAAAVREGWIRLPTCGLADLT